MAVLHNQKLVLNFADYSIFLEGGNRTKQAIYSPIMNQAILSNYEHLLNAYIEYINKEDPLAQFALDYVTSQRLNIVNYEIINISYQLVAGVNVKIYVGDDQYTKVIAVVNFYLELKPKIIRFEARCVSLDSFCNPMTAQSVYEPLESVLIFHPQLFAYRIVNFIVGENPLDKNKLKVMITLQNQNKTRTLIDEQISSDKYTILSLYSFSYEQ